MKFGLNRYRWTVWREATLTGVAAIGSALMAATLLAPIVLSAEPAPSARIAILNTLTTAWSPAPFIEELRRLGYAEGRNLTVDIRSADDRPARLPELAQEIARLKPDVILTVGTIDSTVAAMKANSAIPIVFVHAVDPVRAGLVASLARPGGNVTGVTSLNALLGAKRLELITDIVPGVHRVAVLVSPGDPETTPMLAAIESAARTRRVRLDLLEIRDPSRLRNVIVNSTKAGAGALLVLGSPSLFRLLPSLAQLTTTHRLPAVSAWRQFAEAGGLASYGTPIPEMFQRAARLVDRILRGAKPAELSVEQPTKFELVINLKTAKALGLAIPESVMLQANDVIQ